MHLHQKSSPCVIKRPASDLDFQFLFKLNHLVELHIDLSSRFPNNAFADPIEPIDFELIRRILEELKFLSKFKLTYCDKKFEIRIDHSNSKRSFVVSCSFGLTVSKCSDSNAVIKFIEDYLNNCYLFLVATESDSEDE